jgi:hypothetical protein
MSFLPRNNDVFSSENDLRAMYDAALHRQRERYGAAPTTVEALMYELRTHGLSALAGSNCQRRLIALSHEQLQEVSKG